MRARRAEFVCYYKYDSLAMLADGFHNLSDVLAVAIVRPPNTPHSLLSRYVDRATAAPRPRRNRPPSRAGPGTGRRCSASG